VAVQKLNGKRESAFKFATGVHSFLHIKSRNFTLSTQAGRRWNSGKWSRGPEENIIISNI